eukprot:1161591-Pelagomonas_calceolata.AAC.12
MHLSRGTTNRTAYGTSLGPKASTSAEPPITPPRRATASELCSSGTCEGIWQSGTKLANCTLVHERAHDRRVLNKPTEC